MKTTMLLALLVLFAPGLRPDSAWPTGKVCAVSLTYDDGLDSQVFNAAVDLANAGLTATFLPTGNSNSVKANRNLWEALVRQGHELGSHSMLHPCAPGMGDWQKGNTLDNYDDARMEAELDESVAFIKSLGQKTVRSYAYPCGASWIGKGEARHSYKPIAQKRFRFFRGVGNTLADPATVHLDDTPGWNAQGMSGEDWEALIERTKSQGAWLIVMFHGVGGDHLSCDDISHQRLLECLKKNKGSVWCAPFGQIAATVEGYQKTLKSKP